MQDNPSLLKPQSGWQNAWQGWERFWFRPSSPHTLCFMRLVAGLVIFYVHLNYSFGLFAFMGGDAWVDLESINFTRYSIPHFAPSTNWNTPDGIKAGTGWHSFSIFYHVIDPVGVMVAHCAILTAMFCFMIGFCTRVAAPLAWVGAISYVQRGPTTFFGMDNIIGVLLFYMMFAPSGATYSVDRWLQCWRARKRGEQPPPVSPTISANFVTRLFQIHFCFVYTASGVSKLLGPQWWSGTAIWYTMVNYSFSPMSWPIYTWFVKVLTKLRVIWESFMFFSAYFTLALEIGFVFLIWNRSWRPFLICCSLMLHLGIGLIMGLATFSASMMCFVLCYVPPSAIQRFVDGWGARFRRWKEAAFEKSESQPVEEKELAPLSR